MTNRYIVLLRGINVSGKNKLPMKDLRDMLNKLGYENVQTYIQSGNIILDSNEAVSEIIQNVKEGIQKKFEYDIPVIVRTVDNLKRVIENNPYSKENEKILGVTFLSEVSKEKTIEAKLAVGDHYTIQDDIVYIYCTGGFGNSKLTINLFERKLKVTATNRNWRTTNKLLELATSK